ncbi:protein of unknown function [Chryseobacterium oranimense]|uniref:DUF4760 domain-containing protein n=1 Tax=Chryseobacterium oranimense TaxID=421058 RepID=A0A1M5S7T5_9FLAO|nr:DUF4760 domain-containing protein [Chryseobacterium oranimense]SHH33993.1 protein of unknown function [Chryseobacterium oranimense]
MDSKDWLQIIDLGFKLITLIVVIISARIAYNTLKKSHEWNRRKSTQEVLRDLVLGDYPKYSKVLLDNGIKVFLKTETYSNSLDAIADDKKEEIINATKSIFNLFEFIAINIKNNSIDEDICYDYLGWMYTAYYNWGIEYIKTERLKANDDFRVLGNFEERAKIWCSRLEKERKPNMIEGKPKL